jgi:phosphatidylglycerol:prolipoprotein diacylglycerol transferase
MLTISIDPVAFIIGSLTVRWYGIMVAVAVVSALAITLREAKRLGVPHDIYGLFLWGIIGGFIGGRLAHVIDYWEYYIANPRELIGFAGLALHGTIIGVLVAVWIYMMVRRVPFSSLAGVGDAVALGASLAQAVGRVGCTINGCCFGKPSPFQSFPGAVIYTPRDTIPPEYWGVPLYPAQIYFLLWNLIVFAIVWRFRGKLKPQGSLFFLYLCLYAAGDFALRFFRVNEPFLLGLHQGQVISLAILVVAVPWLIIRLRRFQKQALVTELANGAELEQSHED